MMKTKQDYDMIDRIGMVYSKNETELSWLIRQVRLLMKTKEVNNVTNCISAIYAENDIE